MRRLIVILAMACAISACTPPPSHVARGEAFTTGTAAFDEFFAAVGEVRSQALAASTDEQAAHEPLVKALGLDGSAKSAAALDEATSRAKKLQGKGVLLHLEIAPEPKVVAVRGKAEVGADGEALLKAVESSVKTLLETRKRLAGIAVRAVDLEKRRTELRAQASTTFNETPPAKRDEVFAELDAAKAVLADASDSAGRAAGAASRFVVDLVQAIETGGGAAPADNGKVGRAKKGGVVAGGAKGASPGPAATPAPPKRKPKSGDDFEP